MHVQIITFNLKGLSDEEYRAHCEAIAPAFAQLPGLLAKTWLANAETNTYGGVYLWRNRRSMESYERSDIYGGMLANPHLGGLVARSFPVVEEATGITSNLGGAYGSDPGRVPSTRRPSPRFSRGSRLDKPNTQRRPSR